MKNLQKISGLVLVVFLLLQSNAFAQNYLWQKNSEAIIGGDTVCNAYGGGFSYTFPRPTLFDLDGDGDLDFFFTFGNRITYMENTGSSANPCWTVQTDNFANIYLPSLSAPYFADMNNDGLADLLLGDFYNGGFGGTVHYYQNTSTGGNYSFIKITDTLANFRTYDDSDPVAVPSLNGSFDLVVGDGIGDVYYCRNAGNEQWYSPVKIYQQSGFADDKASPAVADVDNDGTPELLIGRAQTNRIELFERTVTPEDSVIWTMVNSNYIPNYTSSFKNSTGYITPIFTQWDEDNLIDAVLTSYTGEIIVFKNIGTVSVPVWAAGINPFQFVFPGSNNIRSYVNDIDMDSKQEMIFNHSGYFSFYTNENANTVTPSWNFVSTIKIDSILNNPYNNYNFIDMCFFNYDSDSLVDIVACSWTTSATFPLLMYFKNISTQDNYQFEYVQDTSLESILPNSNSSYLRAGDIDDNGNMDILLFYNQANKCERYEKIMQPQLHWEMVNDSFAPGVLPYSFIIPTVIDFDHDGITDIVTSDPAHFFYKNKGNPDSLVYELQLPNSTYLPAGFYGRVELSNLDGNCGLDIYRNTATGIEMWGYGGIQPNISDLLVSTFEICDTNTIHLTALPIGGIWGGWVNTNGDLLPSAFPAPGNYWLTYSYSEPQGCFTLTDSTLISITPCALPLANCSPNSWLAGSIPVSSSVTSGIFTLTNIGLGTLTCSGITGISQPFTTTLVPGSINLTVGQSINFSFTFSPAAVGNYNQTFQLNTNGGIISIDLGGTGIYCPLITGFPYIQDFEGSIFPPDCWIIKDIDGDGNNWKENGIYSAHTGAKAAVSESVASVGLNPDNWLISPQVKISSSIFVLKYWVAAQAQNAPAEHYSILISSSGTNPNDFTEIFNETLSSDTWKLKEVSLSAYNGKNIFIAFRHCNSSNQSALKIDDISVGINATGMDEYSANNGIVYPNPANDWLYISANRLETVEIYDIVGKRMMSDQSNFKLNIGQLPNGTYMVRIITSEGAINRKLLIKHE